MHAASPLRAFRFIPATMSLASLGSLGSLGEGGRPLEVPREQGLELLEWLGLGRPEFGAIGGRELAPLCRRRLWGVARNANAVLQRRTRELLVVAERAGEGMVLFG
jgi:hypothetical protein